MAIVDLNMSPTVKNILIAIGLLVILILLPVILAPILHLSHVDSYFNYGGKESDWITFWGNYLGSVITGLISFVILWYTIKTNKEENQAIIKANQTENTRIIDANQTENSRLIAANQAENTRLIAENRAAEEQRKKQDYQFRFRSEVSVRLSKIDLSQYVGVFFDEKTPTIEALDRLESFHSQIIEDFNSFKILYGGEMDVFIIEYNKLVDIIISRIHDFMILFKDRETVKSDSQKVMDVNTKIRNEISKLSDLKDSINNLWSDAKAEIDKLRV